MPHPRPWPSRRQAAWLRLLAALLAFVMIAAACSSDGDDDAASDDAADGDATEPETGDVSTATTEPPPDETGLEIARGGEITVGIVAETSGWYPPSSEPATSAGFLVMDALYDRWYEITDAGDLIPVLAAGRATPNGDATEWTMSIREGAVFHDGRPIDAQAAADMVDLWNEGPFASAHPATSAVVVDEYTVTYILDAPNPAFEERLAGQIGHAFSPDAARAFGSDASAENPIGSGPFMLEAWNRDSETVVVRNPNYWRTAPDGGTLPYLDRIRFRILPDGTARRAALEAGDLDVMSQAGVDGIPALVDQGFVPFEHIGNGAGLNVYNTAVPPFDDVRVRRAAAHAVNLEDHVALRPANLSGVLEVKTQYWNSSSQWYDEQAADLAATFDLDEAARLTDEYINDPDRSDGRAVGEPIAFTYDCSSDPVNLDTAQLFQQQWQDVGFEVELRTTEGAAFVNQILGVTSDPLFQGDFQIACWADAPNGDPLTVYEARYTDRVENWTNFTDPGIDAAIEALRTTLDPAEREEFAGQIARITAEQQPEFWWAAGASIVLTTPEVRGVETYTFPDGEPAFRRSGGRVWWPEVWIDGATPLADVPDGFLETPAVPEPADEPADDETEEDAAVADGGPNPDVAAAMPAAPDGFSLGDTTAPVTKICDAVDPLADTEPISATHQNYFVDATVGPFGAVSIYELTTTDADAVVAAFASAVEACTDFATLNPDGTTLEGDFVAREVGSFGDDADTYGLAGVVSGLPLDFDFVVRRAGDAVAVIIGTHVFTPADGTAAVPLAEAAGTTLEAVS